MIILRSYQDQGIADIRAQFRRGLRKVCYAAPTGSGKTILFVNLAARIVDKGQRAAIVVHRQELIDQTCAALEAACIRYGVIAAGYDADPTAPVQVCMAQTLTNRLKQLGDIHVLIVDEAHHVMAQTWMSIIAALPQAWVLGVTATPERLDGAGLAEVFDALVIGPSVKQLIAGGWLSPFVVYAPERLVNLKGAHTVAGDYALGELERRMNVDFVLEDALTEYRKHLDGGSAIAFCTTISHSYAVGRFFCAAGIQAQHFDGDTSRAERRRLIAQLATGETQIITNCSLIAEGLDVPSVAGVLLLRPTKSLALHLQQIGRALRPLRGKRAVILDHAGNVFRHGMPDFEHAWSLAGRPKKKGKALVRRCPECGALIAITAKWCPECSTDLRPAPPKPAMMPDPLVELDSATAFERWLANGFVCGGDALGRR
jgi:DNA repair protein RadD